jgi:hypothetical protein
MGVAVGAPESVESEEIMKTWSIHKVSVTALVRETAEGGTFGNPLDNSMWKFHCPTSAISLAIKEVFQSMDVGVPLVHLYVNRNRRRRSTAGQLGNLRWLQPHIAVRQLLQQ